MCRDDQSYNLWVIDQGYGPDRDAWVHVPRQILTSLGVEEGEPILLLGPANREETRDAYTFKAEPHPDEPDPTAAGEFYFQFPRTWLERYWLLPKERWDVVNGPYRLIQEEYNLEQALSFLKEDGTLVIPLGS